MTESTLSAKKPKSNQNIDDPPEVEVLPSESPSPSSSPLLMSPNQPSPDIPLTHQESPSLLQSYLLERLKAPLASAGPTMTKTEQKCLISRPPLTPSSPTVDTLGPSHSLPVSPVPGPASLYSSSQTPGPGKVSVIRSILNSRSKADSPPQQSNKKLIALLTAPLSSQKKVLSKDPRQNEKEAKKPSYTSPQGNLHSLSLSPSQTSRPLPELIPINVFGQPQTDNKDR